MLKVITTVAAMKRFSENARQKGRTIGFVPTMGYLHKGHMALIEKAVRECDTVVVSIYVNPTQFGPKEDLKKYPRDFSRDKKMLARAGVGTIFYPSTRQMYPDGYATYINVEGLSDVLCGSSRPGHFKGVATIVAKLFNIVIPHRAYFGQKDYQQQLIIRKLVKDLDLGIKVITVPTIREKDGLAMSSRNSYLSPLERKNAAVIIRSMRFADQLVMSGVKSPHRIREAVIKMLRTVKELKIDYVAICDTNSLEQRKIIKGKTLIAVAVFIGNTRLIDNIIVR